MVSFGQSVQIPIPGRGAVTGGAGPYSLAVESPGVGLAQGRVDQRNALRALRPAAARAGSRGSLTCVLRST